MLRLRVFYLSCLLLLCSAGRIISCPELIEYAQTELAQTGTLKNLNGFVYLDIDDRYIHTLISFIEKEGFQEPPYFGKKDLIGAHVSVIYQEEFQKYGLSFIEECGKEFTFKIKGVNIVHPPRWKEGDEVYLMTVEAPLLEKLRTKYGLPPSQFGLHITIGIKKSA